MYFFLRKVIFIKCTIYKKKKKRLNIILILYRDIYHFIFEENNKKWQICICTEYRVLFCGGINDLLLNENNFCTDVQLILSIREAFVSKLKAEV